MTFPQRIRFPHFLCFTFLIHTHTLHCRIPQMAPCHLTGTKSIRNNVTSVGQTHTHTPTHPDRPSSSTAAVSHLWITKWFIYSEINITHALILSLSPPHTKRQAHGQTVFFLPTLCVCVCLCSLVSSKRAGRKTWTLHLHLKERSVSVYRTTSLFLLLTLDG